jgi:hypothetical protein
MALVETILGIGTAAAGIFGGSQQDAAANRAAAAQDKYNRQVDRFNWRETRRDYRFNRKGVRIARENNENELAWRESTANQDWEYGLKIQDFEYRNQMQQFAKSEQTYKMQRQFNEIAASDARAAEQRKLQETFTEMAFDNQDLFVKMLQEEGQSMALGQAGRSSSKVLASAIAGYGRNQSIMAESLLSAEKQSGINMKKIANDKYGADIAADANRMIRPERLPSLPKPLAMPRTKFQNPQKPKRPPKPIASARTSSGVMSGVTSGLGTLAGINWSSPFS